MARTLQQASLVMLLGIGRPVFACDIACYNTCVQNCEAMCDQSDDCSAVVMTYVPGAAVDGSDVASVPGSSPVSVSSRVPRYGSYQCGFVSCTDTRGWNGESYIKVSKGSYKEMPNTCVVCPKNATIPTAGGKNLTEQTCALGPRGNATSDCKPADFTRKRHNTLWLPGHPPNMTAADVVALLEKHAGAYDTISMPWAWMNSKGLTWNNTKCADDTAGLCGRQYDNFSQAVADALKGKNYRFVPMLQVCAVCVLNGTWDWKPAMELLLADAKQYGFAGYSLDMEMGGAFNQSGRATFLDTLSGMIHSLGPDTEVQWFSHWRWWPDLSMPNDADWLVSMDSYGPRVGYFAEYWYTTYKCKASVGLSYPGDSLTQMQGFFKNMVSETSPYSGSKGKFRSIGTWGLPDDDGSPMAELWWSSMKAFLAADEDVGQETLSLPAVADTARAAT